MPVCLVKLQREEFKHDKLMPLCLARFVQKTKACDTQCGFFNSIFLQFFNSKKTRRSKLCNLVLLFKVRLQLRGSSGTTEPETTAQHGTCDFQENADYTIMGGRFLLPNISPEINCWLEAIQRQHSLMCRKLLVFTMGILVQLFNSRDVTGHALNTDCLKLLLVASCYQLLGGRGKEELAKSNSNRATHPERPLGLGLKEEE